MLSLICFKVRNDSVHRYDGVSIAIKYWKHKDCGYCEDNKLESEIHLILCFPQCVLQQIPFKNGKDSDSTINVNWDLNIFLQYPLWFQNVFLNKTFMNCGLFWYI